MMIDSNMNDDKTPKLNEYDQNVLNELAEMVNFVKDELVKRTIYKHKLTPKQTLVISMFAAVNSYTEAIFELCKQSRPEAAIVILRSIVEAYINSNFVLGYPNNKLLWIFAIEDSYYRKSFVQLQQEYYTRCPKQRGKILIKKKLKELQLLIEKELQDYSSKLGISFKNKGEFDQAWRNLIDRAQSVDKRLAKRQKDRAGGLESTYLLVYKYFSEYTHLQMRGLQHFWIKTDNGDSLLIDKNPENMSHVLAMTYILYLYFSNRLKQYKLIENSLHKFIVFFDKQISKKAIV